MLSVILTILKVLGIIVGIVVAAILLLVLMVLFVPVRYKAEGKGKSPDLHANGIATWLLFVIRAEYKYENNIQKITVRLFGFPIYKKEIENTKKDEAEKDLADRIVDFLLKVTNNEPNN